VDDGRVRISHTPGLSVTVEEPRAVVLAGRRRIEVLYAVDVSTSDVSGLLMITTRPRGRRVLTVLVVIEDHYEVSPESPVEGRERTVTVDVRPGRGLVPLRPQFPGQGFRP
jgi:hypothetical protein